MDNLLLQLKQLITNQNIIITTTTTTTTTTSTHSYLKQQVTELITLHPLLKYIPQSLLKYWFKKTPSQRNTLLLQTFITSSLVLYILLPSLLPSNSNSKMFTKRPDKHTTGLINLRNDCFANSSLQAYSSLPSLTEYLNKFITSFNDLVNFINSHNINTDELIKLRNEHHKSLSSGKFKASNQKFDIPLHIALASMIKKLQETQMTSKTISVWTFLHELEKIFNAKISRSQHDAQELTQLINETLENENLKLKSFHKFITLHLHQIVPKGDQPSPQDYTILESISVPEFPFDGLILSQMTCLTCHGVSKPTFSPFVMLTLHLPSQPLVKLETLLEENESETIEGYQCIKCRLDKIVANERAYVEHHNGEARKVASAQEEQFLQQINDLYQNPQLCINEDLPESLEDYIKSYNVNGIDISKTTSTVAKKSQILKPPKIFGFHLSRSAFDGQSVTRNSCRVEFKDTMTLSIGKEYVDRLKYFQSVIQDDEEKLMYKLTSSVLTTDENDMEDEDVQRDDFEEKGPADDDEEDVTTDEGKTTDNATTTEDDDDDDDDDDGNDNDNDASSVTSAESAAQTMTTATTLRTGDTPIVSAPPIINSAPMSEQQTEKLSQHFRKFKFNDNDIYKYRLRAVIKHLGSHAQGHYECFKHKPLYVKNSDGNIFKLSPEIMDLSGNIHCDATPVDSVPEEDKVANEAAAQSNNSNNSNSNSSSSSGFSSLGRKVSLRKSSRSVSAGSDKDDDGLRSKFSNLMGRRPSVIQANPKNVEEILHTGLHTPAEILVEDPLKGNNFENAFAQHNLKEQQSNSLQVPGTGAGAGAGGANRGAPPSAASANRQHPLSHEINGDESSDAPVTSTTSSSSEPRRKVKMKKISSLISNPYWRISDGQVSEVSLNSVLAEETSAYMLYYERVDRKQIKRSHRN